MEVTRNGQKQSYLKDLNGKMVKRTPWTHPYNYDEFVVWESGTKRGCSADYSDRLLQWDRQKFEECCLKVFGNKGQSFDNRTPEAIEKFLCLYYKEPIYLTTIVQGCNASSGYPYWIFFYNRAEKIYLGQRVDNGEWIEGDLDVQYGNYHIISDEIPYEIEEPVNYTGLKDKKGAKIWRSSMVKWNAEHYIVNPTFEHQYCLTGMDGSNHILREFMCDSMEVIKTVSTTASMNNVLKEREECVAFILAHYAHDSITPTREIEVSILFTDAIFVVFITRRRFSHKTERGMR